MSVSATSIVISLELALVVAGAVLLWRIVLSPTARALPRSSPLKPWDIRPMEFLMFLLFVLVSSTVAAILASSLAPRFGFAGNAGTVFNGAAAQLGMLIGVAAFHGRLRKSDAPARSNDSNVFVSGAVTFLVALPVLIATAKAWEIFLELSGLPIDRQDLIGMFAEADSVLMLVVMVILAIVIAPVTEDLVFRFGMYRYFRTRMPRWLALAVPALFFASLHVDWHNLRGLSSLAPLTMLAIVFSLAYERTGQIGTAMVAHALFNLNTIVLILGGMPV